jgi:Homeodomain-like domain
VPDQVFGFSAAALASVNLSRILNFWRTKTKAPIKRPYSAVADGLRPSVPSQKFPVRLFGWLMPGPKLVPVLLSDAERESLEALARKRTASQSLAQRARIVLACAEESGTASVTGVAGRLGVSREMVRTWRSRFQEGRLGGTRDTSNHLVRTYPVI